MVSFSFNIFGLWKKKVFIHGRKIRMVWFGENSVGSFFSLLCIVLRSFIAACQHVRALHLFPSVFYHSSVRCFLFPF